MARRKKSKKDIDLMKNPFITGEKKQSSLEKQIGGDHYKKLGSYQPWEIIDALGLNFYEGNALKYLLRKKGDRVEDLRKSIHYIEHLIELEENK